MATLEASFNSGSEVSHALYCRTVRDTGAEVPGTKHSAEVSWIRTPKYPYSWQLHGSDYCRWCMHMSVITI